jgi:ornithine cyclodeaminase/alanine dehydrogenase-like protein (mu-crystallin family)
MPRVLVLNRAEVHRLLDLHRLLDALERAFIDLSGGRSSAPPRQAARARGGILGVMPGYLPGTLEAKLVTVFPGNQDRGVPSHQGLIALFDELDGSILAIMDAEHVTAMRTGGGSAVSVRHLARRDARILAILGAGTQGQSHLAMIPLVREFEEVRVASRTPSHAEALAAQHPAAHVAGSFEEAVRESDVVCCCTDAREPVIRYDWLRPGTHVTAVGGTFGPELDPETVRRARLFVEWRGALTEPPPAGAHDLQGVDPNGATEMGEVLSAARPGRRSDGEITLYRSTGHAVEDAAAARLVYDRALAEGVGTIVTL